MKTAWGTLRSPTRPLSWALSNDSKVHSADRCHTSLPQCTPESLLRDSRSKPTSLATLASRDAPTRRLPRTHVSNSVAKRGPTSDQKASLQSSACSRPLLEPSNHKSVSQRRELIGRQRISNNSSHVFRRCCLAAGS